MCRKNEKHHLQLAFGREGGGGGSRVETPKNNHLRLAFGCEGGGGGGSRVETTKRTTSGSRLDTREVVVVAQAVETTKETTSGSRLDAREEVVVADGPNDKKKPPPARI